MLPKGKLVNANEFVTWSHSKRNQDQKCFCGEYACIGFNYKFGMLELLCFKHYEERKHNETIKKTKETTNGATKSYYEKKEKERKVICHKEKELTEVKKADRQRNLL